VNRYFGNAAKNIMIREAIINLNDFLLIISGHSVDSLGCLEGSIYSNISERLFLKKDE
jgi:hypothetical protein